MWISKEKWRDVLHRLEVLECRDSEKSETLIMILDHLKIAVWKEPSIPAKKMIVSKKDFADRMAKICQNQQLLYYYLNRR